MAALSPLSIAGGRLPVLPWGGTLGSRVPWGIISMQAPRPQQLVAGPGANPEQALGSLVRMTRFQCDLHQSELAGLGELWSCLACTS